ncbi:MAG: helix-turn-helix transcriptional regulator [Clostridiales bacterium]|nr:helix-turn-helix transcriptional regulator [Clostridiales bacterium]MDY2728828.1 helix-turn-helix transcriptional regulator [Clostridium sp.]
MSDLGKLIELIKMAQGDRSLNTFARECGISKSNLSRILNNKNAYPPKPDTLQKIALHSQNNITYNSLMFAAGYLKSYDEDTILNNKFSEYEEKLIKKRIDNIIKELSKKEFDDGTNLTKETIENTLASIEYAIRHCKITDDKKNK